MNPLLLRIGVCVILAAVTCVVAWRTSRRLNAPQMVNGRSSTFDGNNITNCCICLEQLPVINKDELVTLPCKHKFHKRCIQLVFSAQAKNTCPLCRVTVDPTFAAGISSR